jgi:hypothetical protein
MVWSQNEQGELFVTGFFLDRLRFRPSAGGRFNRSNKSCIARLNGLGSLSTQSSISSLRAVIAARRARAWWNKRSRRLAEAVESLGQGIRQVVRGTPAHGATHSATTTIRHAVSASIG